MKKIQVYTHVIRQYLLKSNMLPKDIYQELNEFFLRTRMIAQLMSDINMKLNLETFFILRVLTLLLGLTSKSLGKSVLSGHFPFMFGKIKQVEEFDTFLRRLQCFLKLCGLLIGQFKIAATLSVSVSCYFCPRCPWHMLQTNFLFGSA